MRVYTYYENIDHPKQRELLDLWCQSWKQNGFNPIVLSRKHVVKSEYAQEFVQSIHKIHKHIMDVPCRKYGLTCYNRWLAYSETIPDSSFVCDYDVINLSFTPDQARLMLERENRMTFHHGTTPCLVSANAQQCLKFCKDIVSISLKNMHLLRRTIGPHYNDQEFLMYNRSDIFNQPVYHMDTQPHDSRIVADYTHSPIDLSRRLIHMSHYFCDQARQRVDSKHIDIDTCRLHFTNQLLNTKLDLFHQPVPK